MFRKLLFFLFLFFCIFNTGCSYIFNRHYFCHSHFTQGNNFNVNDIKKIELGMSKEKIISIFGNSLLEADSNKNILYYFFCEVCNGVMFNIRKLVLYFNNNDILIKMHKYY